MNEETLHTKHAQEFSSIRSVHAENHILENYLLKPKFGWI